VSTTDRLFSKYDQIIVYGAKGWFGRSAVYALVQDFEPARDHQILLVGSMTESAVSGNLHFDVFSSNDSLKHIAGNALFINGAYLRREKLSVMSVSEFESNNEDISRFPKDLINSGKIKTLINLSSGVASQGSVEEIDRVQDPYARGKIRDEYLFSSICGINGTQFINCRIFSMSGRFLNEFKNLALSAFIQQASANEHTIEVKSPSTKRTYIDSIDLARVLLELSLRKGNFSIDSGGSITSLGELANAVADSYPAVKVESPELFDPSPDYFGDYESFNTLAEELGIPLKGLNEQIAETKKAFIS
jgi:nucleoside-diphosphate-sugar epimerase